MDINASAPLESETMLKVPRRPPSESAPSVLTSTNLSRGYFPGRGLPCSLFIHGIAFTVMLLLAAVHSPRERSLPRESATKKKPSEVRMVMWLPSVESGGQGGGGRLQSSRNAPSAAPPPGTKGLIYPGPQRIRSDPPQPSNHFQTLLQPDLEALPLLRPPLDLLNLVSMTEVDPVLQPELPDQAVGQPDTVKPEEQQPVKPSDRVATEPVQSGLEVLPLSRPPLDLLDLVSMTDVGPVPQPEPSHLAGGQPDTIKPEEQQPVKPSDGVATEPVQSAVKPQPQTPIDASKPLELAPLPARGANMRNLLALTPMPTLRERPIEIPKGEARGRFAISPEPNLARSETDSTLGKLPSVVTLGNQTGAPGGEIAGTGIADSQVTIAFGPSVSGGGGAGTTPGSRPGSASGPGIGSGSGASDGPGRGPFAGTGDWLGIGRK